MRITDEVKIGGINYTIKTVDTIADNRDLDGQIHYQDQTITLRKDIIFGADYGKSVFLHEIIHGVFEHCGLEQDENIVSRLTSALYQVIKDNQDIFN